jgi:hypothetical protein
MNDEQTKTEQGQATTMSEWSVSFWCKPGNHWRPCAETVMASTPNESAQIVETTDFGMPIRGPYIPNEVNKRT